SSWESDAFGRRQVTMEKGKGRWIAETVAAFHRKFREGAINQKELRERLGEFEKDRRTGAFQWLPVSTVVVERVTNVYAALPATVHLRAADAIHLACAVENSFKE